MKKTIAFTLVFIILLGTVPSISAEEFPIEQFVFEYNNKIIKEEEDNNEIRGANLIENKETVYGQFDLPHGAAMPDYCDVDFYKFKLYRKSHVVIYAETATGEDNIFLTLWDDDSIQAASISVEMESGVVVQILSATLDTGVYHYMVSEPIDDTKYNGLGYMCYFESIPAEERVEKEPTVSAGGLANYVKTRDYKYSFCDVSPDDWFAKDVKTAYELGLVNGINSLQYDPTGEITIAETIALACRLHGIYHYDNAEFHQGITWYQVYVDYAIKHDIIQGGEYTDYTAVATRAQFAAILAKAMPREALVEINTVGHGAIPDVPRNHRYSAEIYMLYRAGILVGNDEKGRFGPESSIQRCEVATIVTRMAIPNERRSIELR